VPLIRDGQPVMLSRTLSSGSTELVPQMVPGPPRWFVGDDLIHEGEWDLDRVEVERNPIPPGVISQEEDVAERSDGGLAASDDHISLRRAAYPPVRDQLDAFWKGGADADAMRERVLAVKAQYPKINHEEEDHD